MQTAEQSIVVNAPPEAAFERWMRMEDFPRFWTTIGEVRQLDPKRFYVRGEQAGQQYEMEAELILQIPGRRIAWRTTSGPASSGVICFEPQPGGQTRVILKILFEPDVGWQEPAAVSERVTSALAKFKELVDQPS